MNPDRLGKLLAAVRSAYPLTKRCEVCFEALPNTVCVPSLTGIASGNPTRAELMMHSVNARELDALGCAFVPADIQNAVLFFDKFRLNNIGVHITYGLPHQTAGSWMTTLRACMDFGAAHVTLDPLPAGSEELPTPELREEFYNRACEFLTGKGYFQYAAHRFCQNASTRDHYYLLRMLGAGFTGFGLGSASRINGYACRNTQDYAQYVAHAGEFDKIVCEAATIPEALRAECWLAGRLRLTEGFSSAEFAEAFPGGFPAGWPERFERMEADGYLTKADGRFSMTRAGFFRIEKLLPQI
jgi:coproporphyrinogen III oxidase-like Fe-S oxidoreductase